MPPEGFCDHSPIGGPSEENFWCTTDMGLTQADTTAITDAWAQTIDLVRQTLIGAGAWAWAFFSHWSPPDAGAGAAACAAQMREICTAGADWPYYGAGVQVQWTLNAPPYNSTHARTAPLPSAARDIAFFLAVRGPYWWLGYGWVGCSVPYDFPDALRVDYGTPLGFCEETGAGTGVFTRPWTKATATVDCNTGSATTTML